MVEKFPDKLERSKIRIIDVAAGTGKVGAELAKFGFTHIDGVGKYFFCNILGSINRNDYLIPRWKPQNAGYFKR